MKLTRSLSMQLVLYWLLGSCIAYFTIPLTVFLPLAALHFGDSSNSSLESWTTKRAKEVLVDALRKAPDGTLYLEQTPAFQRQIGRNPDFRFAILARADNSLVRGSDPALIAALGGARGIDNYSGLFHVVDDANPHARGYVRSIRSEFGSLTVATYGAQFHWDDAFWQVVNFFSLYNFIAFLPLGSAAAIVAGVVVRRSLAPLRAATIAAAGMSADSGDKRISTREMPVEIEPFVDAVNGALARIGEGLALQKRFTANAAHELRTPVTVLRARIAKLEPSDLKHEIVRDVQRVQVILDQLLDLAQLRERKAEKAPALDLGATVLQIAADFMPVAIDAKRMIEFEPPATQIYVTAYRRMIESIVANLIQNALRAEPEGGAAIVRVSEKATIEVVDHGPGIAPEDRALIFEAFWRKDESSPGAGLGLSIAKELVLELGGAISIEDTPGGGATFLVSLPRADAPL